MKILGFNFNKISIERFPGSGENLKINNNIEFAKIEKADLALFDDKEVVLSIDFEYRLDYDPKIALIELNGNILISLDFKMAKDILEQWKEDKKIEESFRIVLLNIILRKSNVKALELEDDLSLPFHIPLPSLRKSDSKEKKEIQESNN